MNAASAAGFVADYERDGYAFPLDVLSADAAAGYLGRIEAAERDFAHLPPDRYLKNNVHIVLPAVDELMRLTPILDAVEAILGPDLWSGAAPCSPRSRAARAMSAGTRI